MRELWYSFRWATNTQHDGRILRLFNRGHKEEFAFVENLQQIGIEVQEYSQALWWNSVTDDYKLFYWTDDLSGGVGAYENVTLHAYHVDRAKKCGVKLKQWRIEDVDGHFGGSLDGIGYGLEFEYSPGMFILKKDPFLLEFKTHGQKSFDILLNKGLKEAKPEHYSQMQIYMLKRGLKFGFYLAVNKNTDELKGFFVVLDPIIATGLLGKASDVISAPQHPVRISNNPSWFKCRFCDHRRTCHLGEPMHKTCRSCQFSKPVAEGQWSCAKWGANIPIDAQKVGCDSYIPITD
jgi:hypothetical protein